MESVESIIEQLLDHGYGSISATIKKYTDGTVYYQFNVDTTGGNKSFACGVSHVSMLEAAQSLTYLLDLSRPSGLLITSRPKRKTIPNQNELLDNF